jgi:uncharacterized protein (TIGR03435 family)
MSTPGHTRGQKLTAGELADSLAFFVQAVVVDKTNLTGRYDIELQWMPDIINPISFATPQLAALSGTGPLPLGEPTGPSIFTALQEQLGLKLESARGPIKTLVIDHVEKPSEN